MIPILFVPFPLSGEDGYICMRKRCILFICQQPFLDIKQRNCEKKNRELISCDRNVFKKKKEVRKRW